jgi:membrane-bound metal-dependent hydrolase YbcI (DUF457 family)
MNRPQHLTVCTLAFIGYGLFVNFLVKISINNITYAFLLAIVGTLLPDFIERPTHWDHRGFFHSKRALKWVGEILLITALLGLIFYQVFIASGFFFGYFMHLLADSTTPRGLPE